MIVPQYKIDFIMNQIFDLKEEMKKFAERYQELYERDEFLKDILAITNAKIPLYFGENINQKGQSLRANDKLLTCKKIRKQDLVAAMPFLKNPEFILTDDENILMVKDYAKNKVGDQLTACVKYYVDIRDLNDIKVERASGATINRDSEFLE